MSRMDVKKQDIFLVYIDLLIDIFPKANFVWITDN